MPLENELLDILDGRVGFLLQQGRQYTCVIREGTTLVSVAYFRTKELALTHCAKMKCDDVFLSLNPKNPKDPKMPH